MKEKNISDMKIMAWFLKPYWFQAVFLFTVLFIYASLETLSVGALYPLVSKILSGADSTAQYAGKILEYLDSVSGLLPINAPIRYITPFGWLVVPDVKWTDSRSLSSTSHRGSHVE
jgi:hypothetical protein